MKNYKRKYEFETEVPVPGIEEIMKIAGDFSDPSEKVEKNREKVLNGKMKTGTPQFDKKMSSMRSQMLKLAEAVAEDEDAVIKQLEQSSPEELPENEPAQEPEKQPEEETEKENEEMTAENTEEDESDAPDKES
ncbi:MAG: hypothetical protein GX099_02230 [Clostridiaceae bacterium]|jgi:hypothetical protein|nr:hypothetical protein [Oscillospiraceae bacterium]NLO62228.1 hypothetical protein [Clostridiaceae bacterium]